MIVVSDDSCRKPMWDSGTTIWVNSKPKRSCRSLAKRIRGLDMVMDLSGQLLIDFMFPARDHLYGTLVEPITCWNVNVDGFTSRKQLRRRSFCKVRLHVEPIGL